MLNKVTPYNHFRSEVIDHLKEVTKSKKTLFTFEDARKNKELANDRVKVIIDSINYLYKNPLLENDYFKYVNCYFEERIKLDEKYFHHDVKKLHEYYSKIDASKSKWNPFNVVHFQSYVLYMSLKLTGCYKPEDDVIFEVKNQDFREYNPLTKIPSVLRGTLPFKVKEFDIKRAFPSFIDIELGTEFKDEVYNKLSKSDFAMFLNANNETKVTISQARKGLQIVYGELVDRVVSDERYNEKGRAFKDFAKYESDYIRKFVETNKLVNYARLHDGIFVLEETECNELNFGKVEFSIKECIKPPILHERKSFYEVVSFGNIYTSPSMYADFLKQENFIRIKSHDDKIQLLKNTNNVIDYFNHKTDLVSFLESEINEPNNDNVRNAIARDNNNVLQQSFTLLEPIKLRYYKDTKTSFGLPFSNGFYYFDKLDGFELKRMEYSEVNGFFTPHQIQQREFEYTNEIGVFETFLNRIITGCKEPNFIEFENEISSFKTVIGYLCHNYKSLTESPCIVLTDEGANDETRNGGRGKTIIGNAIKEVTKTMQKGGNEFVGSYIHNFADLDESHNVYLLDDVPASFNYNDLYTNITGGINVQPKGTKGKMIEFVDSPKFLITTNWLLRYDENDTSTNRRFIEYKIKPYYKIGLTPKDEFQQTFFEDWDALEWNKFYSFIFRCVHHYLINGIERIHYDKTEDNYKASFGSDARESEMARIMELLIYDVPHFGSTEKKFINSFNVTDFLKIYNHFENPLRFERLFSHVNAKKYIDVYLKKYNKIGYHYEDTPKRWFKI